MVQYITGPAKINEHLVAQIVLYEEPEFPFCQVSYVSSWEASAEAGVVS